LDISNGATNSDQLQEVEIEPSKITLERSSSIGSGSFGHVYRAHYGLVPVAVKQLTGQFSEEAFLKEVKALRYEREENEKDGNTERENYVCLFVFFFVCLGLYF